MAAGAILLATTVMSPARGADAPSGKVMIYTSIYLHIIEQLKPVLKKKLPNVDVQWLNRSPKCGHYEGLREALSTDGRFGRLRRTGTGRRWATRVTARRSARPPAALAAIAARTVPA